MTHNGTWKVSYEANEGEACGGGVAMIKGDKLESKTGKAEKHKEAMSHM
jgi:hypothetical protein